MNCIALYHPARQENLCLRLQDLKISSEYYDYVLIWYDSVKFGTSVKLCGVML